MTAATDTFARRVRDAAALVEQIEELLDGPGPVGYAQCRRRHSAIEATATLASKLDDLSKSIRGYQTS